MKIVNIEMKPSYGQIRVITELENGVKEFLFGFLPSKMNFDKQDFIGKTRNQAYTLFYKKS